MEGGVGDVEERMDERVTDCVGRSGARESSRDMPQVAAEGGQGKRD